MISELMLVFALAASGDIPPASSIELKEKAKNSPKEQIKDQTKDQTDLKPKSPVEITESPPMDAEVKRAVEKMQKFYEETKDFEAQFRQEYKHKMFAKKSEASGRVRFMKSGASMRWDYFKPAEKSFVIAAEKVFSYDKEAKQLTIARMSSDRLSASITFLWGQGNLVHEFRISKATRPDLTKGIALELTPRLADPRFQKIFFLLDPKSYAVQETIVVDPDGSENHMIFSGAKTNTGFGNDAFKLNPPEGTQIVRLDE